MAPQLDATAGDSTGHGVVGRGGVQGVLAAGLATAVDGRAWTTVVEGGAGSGKTVLLRWLEAQPAARAFRQVTVCPVEGEADLPLAVMTDVLRPLPHIADLLLVETGVAPTPSVVARIRDETSGNPLAVRHLARHLRSHRPR